MRVSLPVADSAGKVSMWTRLMGQCCIREARVHLPSPCVQVLWSNVGRNYKAGLAFAVRLVKHDFLRRATSSQPHGQKANAANRPSITAHHASWKSLGRNCVGRVQSRLWPFCDGRGGSKMTATYCDLCCWHAWSLQLARAGGFGILRCAPQQAIESFSALCGCAHPRGMGMRTFKAKNLRLLP